MRQEELQIDAALGISNRNKTITNRGMDVKSGQRDFKLVQRLQIGAGITNRCKTACDYRGVEVRSLLQFCKSDRVLLWII